jgi:hypothetical protein
MKPGVFRAGARKALAAVAALCRRPRRRPAHWPLDDSFECKWVPWP